jgi:hypothetical protein
MDEPAALIMTACVNMPDGTTVAQIERVRIGGGTQVVTVDGVPEERVHPTLHGFHVRLLSPDRMIPDELRDAETYEQAVELAMKYAAARAKHAAAVDELAADLKV